MWSLALSLLIWTSGHAVAQNACQNLEEALVTKGKANATYIAEKNDLAKNNKPEPGDERAKELALSLLAGEQPNMTVKLEGDTLAGPGAATIAIEDKSLDAPQVEISKLCVKVYSKSADKWTSVTVRQIALADKVDKTPKRLNVTFDIKAPGSATVLTPSEDVDYLLIATLSDAKTATLLNFSKTLTVRSRWWSFVWTALLVIASYLIIAWATFDPKTANDLTKVNWLIFVLNPVRISAASYGEASMSQLQVLAFTLIVGGLLFHLWMSTLILSDISTDLLKLIGISAIGAAGAKFTHTLKVTPNDQTSRFLIGKGWYNWEKEPLQDHATFKKLLLTDGRLDIYKFQIAIFTLVVACYVISAGQAGLGDVKISETMLYLIGISQGVYVGGKAVTDRTTDLEAAVQKMIDLESKIDMAKAGVTGATPAADLPAVYAEYRKAAITAVQEFTGLQNRKFPTIGNLIEVASKKLKDVTEKLDRVTRDSDEATRKLTDIADRITTAEAQLQSGTPRPASLLALDTQKQTLDAQKQTLDAQKQALAAQKQQIETEIATLNGQRSGNDKDIRNIDPAVLKP